MSTVSNLLRGITNRWQGKIGAALTLAGRIVLIGEGYTEQQYAEQGFYSEIRVFYGAPVNGGSGTFVGFAPFSTLLIDVENANLYMNTGSLASPTWTLLGGASGAPSAFTAADGITAHAAGGQASATQLGYGINRLSVVATGGDSVALPAAIAGAFVEVINDGVAAADVYTKATPGTDTIDGGADTAAAVVTNAKRTIFTCASAGKWSSMGGSKSA
jgi:hypothetical protein